jgi:hypothetical protein
VVGALLIGFSLGIGMANLLREGRR